MRPVYAVTGGRDIARVAAAAAVSVVVVVVIGELVDAGRWVRLVMVAVGLLAWLPSLRAAWTCLAVQPAGLSFSVGVPCRRAFSSRSANIVERRFVAWPVVHRLEVDQSRDLLRVVLTADAPLPPWLRGRIVDLRDPESGPVVERTVPGIDAPALSHAVLAVSPRTSVVTR